MCCCYSQNLDMLRCLACCCGSGGDRLPVSGVEDDEEDFLLGGGELEWNRVTRRFTRTNRSVTSDSSYVPPILPHVTATPPTIEDFRLLKTVGKGAFGKVRQQQLLLSLAQLCNGETRLTPSSHVRHLCCCAFS